jgi:hypothetical protein
MLNNVQTESVLYAVLGVFVAITTSFLKNANWSPKSKQTLTVILSTLAGWVSTYFEAHGTADLTSIAKNTAYAYAVSQIFYGYLLKDSTINEWLVKFNLLQSRKKS